MYPYLLESAKPLLKQKLELGIACIGLVVMTVSFGAGIGLMLPIFNFLLNEGKSLGELADSIFNGPLEPMGDQIASMMPADKFNGFMLVMLGLFVLTVIGGIGRFLHTYMIIRATSRVVQHWRLELYRKTIYMNMDSFWAHGVADGASRIMGDVTHLSSGYQGVLVRSTQAILKVVIALTIAFIINWQLTMIAMIGGPVIAVVVRKFGKSVRDAMKHTMVANAQMLMRLNESVADPRVIKLSQGERSEFRRFFKLSQEAFREGVRQHRIRAISSLVVEIVAMVGVIAVAALSAKAIFHNGVPASQFMMILGALVAAGASFKPLSNLHHDLTVADAAAKRIIELRDRVEPDDNQPGQLPKLPHHQKSIRFQQVSYTYPGAAAPALSEIDLMIEFGQTVAIVGSNGSGKSTLVAALTRLVKPDTGQILIDEHDLMQFDLRSVRAQMAMVTQKSRLYKGSVAENIAYGRPWSRQEDIIESAKLAKAHAFISEMPQGYLTQIGEGGEGVSGGQAQRLCIARAVLRKPSILILDEATSQVDSASEMLITDAMHQISDGRTTIVIAHRMSTFVHADQIIVMDSGKIIAQGKHEVLCETCPSYQALIAGQLADHATS